MPTGHYLFWNYNIPRKIRELQQLEDYVLQLQHYNIPRKIRELQRWYGRAEGDYNYNIPRKIRELQHKHMIVLI